jgi:Na+/melibiose symporter-like transporter
MNLHPTVSQSSDDTIKRVMTQPYQDRTTMLNAIRFVANEGARGASMIVIVLCVLLTGCAGGVTQTAQYSAQIR